MKTKQAVKLAIEDINQRMLEAMKEFHKVENPFSQGFQAGLEYAYKEALSVLFRIQHKLEDSEQ